MRWEVKWSRSRRTTMSLAKSLHQWSVMLLIYRRRNRMPTTCKQWVLYFEFPNVALVWFCLFTLVLDVLLKCSRSFLTDCILQLCDFQIKKLKEERQKAENEIVRLEKKVADAAKGMQSRDQLIETLQDSCSRLKSEIEQITVIVCFMFMSWVIFFVKIYEKRCICKGASVLQKLGCHLYVMS